MNLLEIDKRSGRGLTNVYRVVYSLDEVTEENEKGGAAATLSSGKGVASVHEKGGNATFFEEEIQALSTPKDTFEGYNQRTRSSEEAPFHGNAVSRERLYPMAKEAFGAFPSEAGRFISNDGDINLGGFLTLMDRRARSAELTAEEIDRLLNLAEIVFDNTECGTAEYGLAYRLIQTEHEAKDQLARGDE
jgi:hypothetical protein